MILQEKRRISVVITMDKKTTIVLWIILISIASFLVGYSVDKIVNEVKAEYQQQGANAIIITINQRGEIPILVNETSVNWIPIQQICEGGK